MDGSRTSPLLYRAGELRVLPGGVEGITRQKVLECAVQMGLRVTEARLKPVALPVGQTRFEEIFRGLQQELGWTGHRHWRRAKLLGHLALGLVAYGLMERQREELGLSFYQCRRKLIAGKLRLDLSPLVSTKIDAA